jgi:excisionase family DNA binding protein
VRIEIERIDAEAKAEARKALTRAQAAQMLNLSVKQIDRLVGRRELVAYRDGRKRLILCSSIAARRKALILADQEKRGPAKGRGQSRGARAPGQG